MDKTGKRTADSGQTIDTFAVCSKCSRLSYNLKQCDKCGNALSEDNAAMCVSAEPKRSRLESPANGTNGTLVNGNDNTGSTSHSGEEPEPATTGSSEAPVPQALYKNINVSESNVAPQPQALYMNMNFRSDSSTTTTTNTETVSTVSSSRSSTTVHSAFHTGLPTVNTTAIPPNTAITRITNSTSGGTQMAAPLQTGPPPLVSTAAMPNQTNANNFSNFNLPTPPPPYSQVSNSATAPVTNSTMDSDENDLLISNNDSNIALPATQIRIGTRKFLPASSVTFKEDGVLFALKDFTHAPVLLNARAIIKCEANMDTFPVFFVYLEATCIRQIRNIFSLTTDEFLENSPAGIKKCITIFPNITSAVQKELRGRVAVGIRKIFNSMSLRYPRQTAYLQEITNMQVIDLLFDTMRPQRTSDIIPRGMSPSRPPTTVQTPSSMVHHIANRESIYSTRGVPPRMVQGTQNLYDTSHAARQGSNMIRLQIPSRDGITAAGMRMSQASSRAPQRGGNMRPVNQQVRPITSVPSTLSQPQGKQTSASLAGTTAPLLVVPSDQAKWASMQKDLVEGGVYHVELPTKERKYFLWDGARLVPCLVQNTEVQLNCLYLRIGSLRADAKDVKIRADNPSAFMFTVKSTKTGTVPIQIGLDMISNSVMYSEAGSDKTLMFVNLSHPGWWNLQTQLKLTGDTDPCFNPSSGEARRKHIVMVFKGVNQDQRDALMGIKVKTTGAKIFSSGHHNMVLKVLSEIYNNMPQTCKQNFRGTSNKFHPNTAIDIALKEFMDIDSGGISIEDDDDDVIMTSEEVGVKCPYTQQVMKEPVQNKICNHNYEKAAIQEFIVRKKGNAKCPYAGCGNTKPLSMLDLLENTELKLYISRQDKT